MWAKTPESSATVLVESRHQVVTHRTCLSCLEVASVRRSCYRCVVVEVIQDDAGANTGDERDSVVYRVEVDGEQYDFRWRDLRSL